MAGYIGKVPFAEASRQVREFGLTAGQTTINTTYTPGFVDVILNGIFMAKEDYDAKDGLTIVFKEPMTLPENHVIVISYNAFRVADTYTKEEADKRFGVSIFSVQWWPNRATIPNGYVPADGQELVRAVYPTAVEGIQNGVVPVIDDETWLNDPTKRGCYTLGDGETTFRVPDYNGKSAGSLGAVFLRGDGSMSAGEAGVIQQDALQNITGSFNQGGHSPSGSGAFYTGNKSNSNSGLASDARIIHFDASRVARTADETRPLNVTGCWIIKLYGAILENGTANLTQLLSDYNTLSNDIDFTIIYPNGGTEENPANVEINSRYVEPNPFPGREIACLAEVMIDGEWGESPYGDHSASGSRVVSGVHASLFSGSIVIQTGIHSLTYISRYSGDPFNRTTGTTSAAPCRVKVWKVKG